MATSRDVKVGFFVLLGLVVSGLVIFMIGDERRMFQSKVEYQAVFKNVQGLKRGSPVRMGGVDVGTVSQVGYGKDANDPNLYVTFSMVEEDARRLRADSVAEIGDKGLLGDKMIVISPGSPGQPQLPVGGTVPSKEAEDLSSMMSKVTNIGSSAERVMGNLEKTTGTLADKDFNDGVRSSVRSLSSVLDTLDTGQGYIPRLLRDDKEADRLSHTIQSLDRATAELDRTLSGINAIVARVQHGPGFAHEVIYGESGSATLAHFGDAAEELALTLRGVREGNGVARSLIYGDDQSQQIMGNLNAVSRDLRIIMADVRAGKGTVGALLVDPSVYEDIKVLLGNVQRNQVLRSLVRYSIRRDEKPGAGVHDATPPPGGGSASAPGAQP